MKKRLLFFIVVVLLLFEITFTSAQGLSQENVIGFTGQDYFESVDLVLFPYRAYSPETGRFLQRDPSGYVDGVNLYEYVSGNALSATDSLGLDAASSGISLARRLQELTKAGKINVDEFASKMISAKSVELGELRSAWKNSLLQDPHRQLTAAVGIHGIPDLNIEIRGSYGLSAFSPPNEIIVSGTLDFDSRGFRRERTILQNLDHELGHMVDYWLSGPTWERGYGSDDIRTFRIEIDAELFATKGDVHQAVAKFLEFGSESTYGRGYQHIIDEALNRGYSLTNTQAYGVARYLDDIAGREKLTPYVSRLRTSVPSEFLLDHLQEALDVVTKPSWKTSFIQTLYPGSDGPIGIVPYNEISLHKQRKIIELLSKIENSR